MAQAATQELPKDETVGAPSDANYHVAATRHRNRQSRRATSAGHDKRLAVPPRRRLLSRSRMARSYLTRYPIRVGLTVVLLWAVTMSTVAQETATASEQTPEGEQSYSDAVMSIRELAAALASFSAEYLTVQPSTEEVDQRVLAALLAAVRGGVLLPFLSAKCPEGWTQYDNASERFLIGASESMPYSSTGGTTKHAHDGRTSGDSGSGGADNDNDFRAAYGGHTHGLQTSQVDYYPPYVSVLFCVYSES